MEKQLGQNGPDGKKRVRVASMNEPKRDEGMWRYVEVIQEHATSPMVKCIFCAKMFSLNLRWEFNPS